MVKRKTSCFLDILLSLMPVEIGSCRHWEVSLRRSARSRAVLERTRRSGTSGIVQGGSYCSGHTHFFCSWHHSTKQQTSSTVRSVKMHLIDFSRRMLCASLVLTTVKASSLARHRTGLRKHRCICGFTYYNLSASRWNWAAGAGWQCGNFFRADPL